MADCLRIAFMGKMECDGRESQAGRRVVAHLSCIFLLQQFINNSKSPEKNGVWCHLMQLLFTYLFRFVVVVWIKMCGSTIRMQPSELLASDCQCFFLVYVQMQIKQEEEEKKAKNNSSGFFIFVLAGAGYCLVFAYGKCFASHNRRRVSAVYIVLTLSAASAAHKHIDCPNVCACV